ncbi:hypothetical protein KUTeg_014920 [Tegillarca granosa]|uniref:Glycosyltransferase 61 catalytic domain-containing protein n=1 Tax=Tegillarca granosa TaxID=220873 RepID=A0ABQ9ESA4_TEGGR|nr:hypothetical protein KUTeg_014920 [Tegillarca granosa]
MQNSRKLKLIVTTIVMFAIIQLDLLYNTWVRQSAEMDHGQKEKYSITVHSKKVQKEKNVYDNLNVKYIEFYAKNRSDIQRKLINYSQFQLPEPLFISEQDRSLFYKNPGNVKMSKMQNATEKLRGEIYNVRNGTFTLPYDCGYKSNYTFVTQKREIPKRNWHFALAPMIIPEANTFQHFLDGALPKFMQALEYLQKPDMKILILPPRDKIIFEIIDRLNISQKNLIIASSPFLHGADNLFFTCNTPPLHSVLWSKARRLIGAHETRTSEEIKVILITRAGSYNKGRNLLNMQEVIQTLHSRYGIDNVHVFKGPYSLNKSIEIFGKIKIIIGVHGGGLYNLMFCPKNTAVVEIMPTLPDGRMLAASDSIFWAQAYMLEQIYWRLITTPKDSRGNVIVDIKKLNDILDKIVVDQ